MVLKACIYTTLPAQHAIESRWLEESIATCAMCKGHLSEQYRIVRFMIGTMAG